MRYPFEATPEELEADLDQLVDAVFSSLESEFLVMPRGDGFIDYPAFFRGLKEGGFDGIASYEMCSPIRGGGAIENLDAYASSYIEWMRKNT